MSKLNFQVKATAESEALAAFQYIEWAVEWRDKMVATGVLTEIDPPIVGGDNTHLMIPTQTDGAGMHLTYPELKADGK